MRQGGWAWGVGVAALLGAVFAALALGRYPIPLASLLPGSGAMDPAVAAVLWNVRLPRVLAAILVGAGLAGAGAAFQGMFRNPLASPDLLGVSVGASLGAVLGIFFGLPVAGVQAAAFVGGLGAVAAVALLVDAVRRGAGGDPVLLLVLAGIALGALLGAAISLLKALADPYNQLPAITFWLLGSLSAVTRGDLLAAAMPAGPGLLLLFLLRWRLNLLTLGEDEARALGAPTGLLRGAAILGATLATAAVTALAGAVGWVGLVVPHVARLLVGPGNRRLMPIAACAGAIFMVAADTLARSVSASEIPIGILTDLIGVLAFLAVLPRVRRGWI